MSMVTLYFVECQVQENGQHNEQVGYTRKAHIEPFHLYLGSILMLRNISKNSSNQLKKTCLSSGERFLQSIAGLAWAQDGRSGRVDRTTGGGLGERFGRFGGEVGGTFGDRFGDRFGRGGAADWGGTTGLRLGGAGDDVEADGRL